MGRAKDEWLEAQERGWVAPDKYVCRTCIYDKYLGDVIDSAATVTTCDYCEQSSDSAIAAPMSALLEPIADAVRYYFEEPAVAGVPYDEGFVIEHIDTYGVLYDLGLDCDEKVFSDVVQSFANCYWVAAAQGHWAGSHEHERLRDSWNGFVHAVKHETRFHFGLRPASSSAGLQELEPGEMLGAIGRGVSNWLFAR